MTLRARLVVAAASAVALAVVLASGFVYAAVRDQLRGQIDDALRARSQQVIVPDPRRGGFRFELEGPRFGGAGGYVQLVDDDGNFRTPHGILKPLLPIAEGKAVAAGKRGEFFTDKTVDGTHIRVFTTLVADRIAAQVARPLDEVDSTLHRLALLLVAVALSGVAVAAGAGFLVARAALAPVRRLTDTAEHVSVTHDLSQRIKAATGNDELARLARSFNAMLAALEESVGTQRSLVADASHELRTPLTSLRTNVEVLERADVSDEVRGKIVKELRGELEELTGLVQDLVELARGNERPGDTEPVQLDVLVANAVERAQRYAPSVTFETQLEPTVVDAVPSRVERAVANLIDNAVKWSPPGGVVEVAVRDGEVVVRDHGPGIAEEDLPHVFQRFYRARAARGVPGSGLGLAIVRQVAEEHGGSVQAETAAGGGARMRLRF